jgi:hypothetical protein
MAGCRVLYLLQSKSPVKEYRRIRRKRQLRNMEVLIAKCDREEEELRRKIHESEKDDDLPEAQGVPEEITRYTGVLSRARHCFRQREVTESIKATRKRVSEAAQLYKELARIQKEKEQLILAHDQLKSVDVQVEAQRREKAFRLAELRQEEAAYLPKKEEPAKLPRPKTDPATRARAAFLDVPTLSRLQDERYRFLVQYPDLREEIEQYYEEARMRIKAGRP